MKIRIKLKFILVIVLLLAVAAAGCKNDSTPSNTLSDTAATSIDLVSKPLPLNLEEQTLSPVFSNIGLLRGIYRQTLHFTNTYLNLVFGSLPDQLNAEFEELITNSGVPDPPDKLTAYKVIRPAVDEIYARQLASRLGFSGDLAEDKSLKYPDYRFHNGPASDSTSPVLSIFKDGSISLWNNGRYNVPPVLPSAQQSIDIARDWLNAHHLYPKGEINIETSPKIMFVMQDRMQSQFVYATSVSFIMRLDGYELFGMGAYFLVGDNGMLLEAHINEPEFEPYTSVNIEKPDAAIDKFRTYLQNPSKFRADSPDCMTSALNRNMSLSTVSLKYFAMLNPDSTQTAYAQPIYLIEGQGRDKPDLSWDRFIGAIDAVQR